MKNIKNFLIRVFKQDLSHFKWGRKYIGGKWYRMRTALPMADIWTQIPFESCQARLMEIEDYEQR